MFECRSKFIAHRRLSMEQASTYCHIVQKKPLIGADSHLLSHCSKEASHWSRLPLIVTLFKRSRKWDTVPSLDRDGYTLEQVCGLFCIWWCMHLMFDSQLSWRIPTLQNYYYYYYLFNKIKWVQKNRTERKSNANGKRKTQWCSLSLHSHNNTVSCSRVYANVSAKPFSWQNLLVAKRQYWIARWWSVNKAVELGCFGKNHDSGKCCEKRLHCLSVMSLIYSDRDTLSPAARQWWRWFACRDPRWIPPDSEHQAPLVSTANEQVGWYDGGALCRLVRCKLLGGCTSWDRHTWCVRRGISVWDGDVHCQRFSLRPRNQGRSIRTFPICSWQSNWLLVGWCLRFLVSSPYKIV